MNCHQLLAQWSGSSTREFQENLKSQKAFTEYFKSDLTIVQGFLEVYEKEFNVSDLLGFKGLVKQISVIKSKNKDEALRLDLINKIENLINKFMSPNVLKEGLLPNTVKVISESLDSKYVVLKSIILKAGGQLTLEDFEEAYNCTNKDLYSMVIRDLLVLCQEAPLLSSFLFTSFMRLFPDQQRDFMNEVNLLGKKMLRNEASIINFTTFILQNLPRELRYFNLSDFSILNYDRVISELTKDIFPNLTELHLSSMAYLAQESLEDIQSILTVNPITTCTINTAYCTDDVVNSIKKIFKRDKTKTPYRISTLKFTSCTEKYQDLMKVFVSQIDGSLSSVRSLKFWPVKGIDVTHEKILKAVDNCDLKQAVLFRKKFKHYCDTLKIVK